MTMATTPNFEDFQNFSKQQLEAITSASSTWAKGLQELAAETTDYSKKALAVCSEAIEKLVGARSVEAAIQIQTDYAKQAYEGLVAQASKFSELYAKVATDALKPVTTAYTNMQPK
jgi:phasin family protein